jgi:MFS family permease
VLSRSTWLTTLAFALLGPAFGILSWLASALGHQYLSHSKVTMPDAAMLAAVTGWAYFFCCIPAAATGFVWGIAARRLSDKQHLNVPSRILAGAVIGGLMGAAAGLAWDIGTILTSAVALFSMCGAVAGGALAVPFPLAGWLLPSSNNRWRGP